MKSWPYSGYNCLQSKHKVLILSYPIVGIVFPSMDLINDEKRQEH